MHNLPILLRRARSTPGHLPSYNFGAFLIQFFRTSRRRTQADRHLLAGDTGLAPAYLLELRCSATPGWMGVGGTFEEWQYSATSTDKRTDSTQVSSWCYTHDAKGRESTNQTRRATCPHKKKEQRGQAADRPVRNISESFLVLGCHHTAKRTSRSNNFASRSHSSHTLLSLSRILYSLPPFHHGVRELR